jgi:broad specificity phosphatase PhoE
MPEQKEISGFVSRHAESAKHREPHETYTSLTPEGVRQARERARSEVLEIIQEAPKGAVIFIGGGSDQLRTRETGEIYGEELNKIVYEGLKGVSDVEVITKRDIEQATTPTYHQVLKRAQETGDERELRKIAEDLKRESYAITLRQIEEIIKENPATKPRARKEG